MKPLLVVSASILLIVANGTPGRPDSGESTFEATIRGTVVDPAGKSVAGAKIEAVNRRGQLFSCHSNRDGTFVLPLDAQFVRLIATDPSSSMMGINQFHRDDHPTPVVEVVIKVGPTDNVRMQVVDRSGRPIPDASTEIIASNNSVGIGKTDAQGRFSLRILRTERLQSVLALKSGLGFDYRLQQVTNDGRATLDLKNEIRLTLDGARQLLLTAVDVRGNPVPGMTWQPLVLTKDGLNKGSIELSNSRIVRTVTDLNGVANLDWFPSNCPGIVTFGASDRYFRPTSNAHLEGGSTRSELRVVCKMESPRAIAGQVRKPDGSPAANVLVKAVIPHPARPPVYNVRSYGESGQTDADGRYEIPLRQPGVYSVAIIDDEWNCASHLGVNVRSEMKVTGIDFQLTKGTLLRGRVRMIQPGLQARSLKVMLALVSPSPLNAKRPKWAALFQDDWSRSCEVEPGTEYQFRATAGSYELRVKNQIHHFTIKDEKQHVCHFMVE